MAWRNQRVIDAAIGLHIFTLKSDSFVLICHGCPSVEPSGGIYETSWHAREFITSLFTSAAPATEAGEGGQKQRRGVTGLESAFTCFFHPSAHFLKVHCSEHFGIDCSFLQHLITAGSNS